MSKRKIDDIILKDSLNKGDILDFTFKGYPFLGISNKLNDKNSDSNNKYYNSAGIFTYSSTKHIGINIGQFYFKHNNCHLKGNNISFRVNDKLFFEYRCNNNDDENDGKWFQIGNNPLNSKDSWYPFINLLTNDDEVNYHIYNQKKKNKSAQNIQ